MLGIPELYMLALDSEWLKWYTKLVMRQVRIVSLSVEVPEMLENLIAEATECDYKVALETRRPKSWLKSVSAFANGIGGMLLLC